MQVNWLDHVNVITDKLDETAEFYKALLNLERRNAPPPLTPDNAQWMYDAGGKAIVHINSVDCPRAFDRPVEPGALTGAVHHVALNCSGYEELMERVGALGTPFQLNTVASIGLRQIFVSDPNNVLLELNFFGD
ncbi:VOC family protein [Novosphingobium sp.]|uniref:VOC family protein n=1 Tax=Novosphingobium sp. TaxID=1874826 RepID=UPI00261D1408|nr:VOC family protein [Novosphingobium sp.]